MTQWTISRRIFSGGTVLLVLFALVGVFASLSFIRLRRNAVMMRDDVLPGLVATNEIMNYMYRAQIDSVMALEAKTQTECQALLQEIAKQTEHVKVALDDYEKSIYLDEDRQNFEKLKGIRAKYVEVRKEFTDLLQAGRIDEAAICMRDKVSPAFKAYDAQLVVIAKWNVDYGEAKAADSYAAANNAVWVTSILEAVAVVLALLIVALVLRGINRRLTELAKVLTEASSQVSGASSQVAGASQTLAEGASKQAAALEESSAAVEELSGMAKRNSQSAGEARALALEAKELTAQGTQQMAALVQAMDGIKASSDKIAKVVKTIDEISFQTNILALNAAVEAARAGEAGAGFAVVADEVRSLAQRAALASRETSEMIEESLRTTSSGSSLTHEVAGSLSKIEQKAARVGDLVSEIATASGEQAQGLEQVTRGVSEMDQITQQNASNAEETASAAEELSAQSISMKEHVDGLRALIGGAALKTS